MERRGLTGDAFIDIVLYVIFFFLASFGIYHTLRAMGILQ